MRWQPLAGPILPAVCAVLLLGACAATPPNEGMADVALITVPEAAKLTLIIDKHPDATSSLERALMLSGDVAKGEHILREALAADASAGPRFIASLSDEVRDVWLQAEKKQGKRAIVVPESHFDRIELLSNYAALGAKAGVVIDVIPRTLGYWAVYPDRVYRPWVRLEYRIHDVRTNKVVATGMIGTGPAPADGEWTSVVSDDALVFASFEALVANPALAAKALRATVDRVAEALAQKI